MYIRTSVQTGVRKAKNSKKKSTFKLKERFVDWNASVSKFPLKIADFHDKSQYHQD